MSDSRHKDACSKCGAVFECGMGKKASACWCAELPLVMPVKGESGSCLCRKCLEAAIAAVRGKPPA